MQSHPQAGLREEGVVGSDPSSGSAPLCARCGSPLAPGARFCGHCGLTVPGDAGQRRAAPPPHAAARPEGGSDAVTAFLLGIDVLKRYPVIVTPPLIAMCVVLAVGVVLFGSAMSLFAAGGLAGHGPRTVGAILGSAILALVFFAVAMLINLISSAVVVVMARDALAARGPSLGTAYGMVLDRLGDVVGASFLCAVIIGIASFFLIIPGLIAAFFLMFALPAVLLDGAGPIESLRRSATLVRDNIGRALGLVIGAIVASVVTWLASIVLHVIPVVGHLASMLLAGVFVAYLTVVAVRIFLALPRS